MNTNAGLRPALVFIFSRHFNGEVCNTTDNSTFGPLVLTKFCGLIAAVIYNAMFLRTGD
jgi:hypothetical protein